MVNTNLSRLEGARTRPVPGDVFRLRVGGVPLLGRVISTTAQALVEPTANLIYIFEPGVVDGPGGPADLTVDRLLIPPRMTNDKPWTLGYFVTVATRPFGPREVIERHCFRGWDGRLYDEAGRSMDEPIEPVGEWGLASYRVIDDELSAALGIPLAQE